MLACAGLAASSLQLSAYILRAVRYVWSEMLK
jgi:hypothetical protein